MVRFSSIEIIAQCEGQTDERMDSTMAITTPSRAHVPVSINHVDLTKGPQGHLHCNTSITVYCKYHQFD